MLSWISWFRDEQFGKKTHFEAKFVKRIKFNHILFLIDFWNETSTAYQSVNQTLVFTTCQFLNQPFYYPSDLNRTFYNASDFEVKLFPENPVLLSFIQKDHFFVSFNHRNVKIDIFVLSRKLLFSERCFGEVSNLESNFPRRIRFWLNFFTKRPILNREVWNMSNFVPSF